MSDVIVGFALDRSFSMHSIWRDAEGGFNSYKNSLREDEGNTWLTLVAFDDRIDEVYTAWNVQDIPDLPKIATDYQEGGIYPRGNTALLDAAAKTIVSVEDWLASNHWFNGKVLIVINTDGEENSSVEVSKAQLSNVIKEKEEQGWTFVFMGANIDAFAEAGSWGVAAASTMQYSHTGTSVKRSYDTLSAATTRMRSVENNTDDFFNEDEQVV